MYMDNYIKSYPTVDRYIEAYGGELTASKPVFDHFGVFTIEFNRNLVFDKALVEEYMPDYEEPNIEVVPSD